MRQVGLPIADATRVLGISLPDNIIRSQTMSLNSSNAADLAPSDFRFSKGSCSGKARTQDAPRERYYLRPLGLRVGQDRFPSIRPSAVSHFPDRLRAKDRFQPSTNATNPRQRHTLDYR